jgi:hypothetical protein
MTDDERLELQRATVERIRAHMTHERSTRGRAAAQRLTDPKHEGKETDPRTKFTITDVRRFAIDVKCALLAEAEDGSSLLTNVLDEACRVAIEDGSEFFVDKEES